MFKYRFISIHKLIIHKLNSGGTAKEQVTNSYTTPKSTQSQNCCILLSFLLTLEIKGCIRIVNYKVPICCIFIFSTYKQCWKIYLKPARKHYRTDLSNYGLTEEINAYLPIYNVPHNFAVLIFKPRVISWRKEASQA